MRLSHDPRKISATFDDPNLVSRAGLVPVMALAEQAGLIGLVRQHVRIAAKAGVLAEVKVGCLVAGMAAGRIRSMTWTCCGTARCRSCSTVSGRRRRWGRSALVYLGNVLQMEKADWELRAELARRTPLLPGAGQLAFVDIDSSQRRVYGHKKQGAA